MSQSIYGIRIPGTIGDVINQLDGMRPLMRIKAREHIARAIARIATDEIDRDAIFETGLQRNYLSEAHAEVKERRLKIEREQVRDPMVDTTFDVVLRGEGYVIIMMSFTEHAEWFEELLSLPGAEDYSYWDGADRPDTVSEEEWTQRRRTYSRILSNDPHGRPAGVGVTHSFQSPVAAPEVEMILSMIPSIEDRAHRMARQVIFSKWIESKQGEDLTLTDRIRFISEMDNPEMAEAVTRVAEDIRDKLPEVTERTLRDGLKGDMLEDTPEL